MVSESRQIEIKRQGSNSYRKEKNRIALYNKVVCALNANCASFAGIEYKQMATQTAYLCCSWLDIIS